MSGKVGVLIVDDSAIVRQVLRRGLSAQAGIEVVGAAPDPYVARDMIVKLKPDVITLDIQMPRMDGLTFLRKLMRYHPVPTIIVSSLTPEGCDIAIACLEAGAVDVVAKPSAAFSVGDMASELGEKIRAAAAVKIAGKSSSANNSAVVRRTPVRAGIDTSGQVIAMGSSTGGTEALKDVLSALPIEVPGIVMTQHMPKGFTASFAQRLNDYSAIEVREAKHGDAVEPGLALLAPGDKHMKLAREGAGYIVRLGEGPRVCRHRPSVEVLFESTAAAARNHAMMGIIMTGMGSDGAQGLLSMRQAGAFTVAQDEASCVVFGMPREAIERNAAAVISPLKDIPNHIMDFAAGVVGKANAA